MTDIAAILVITARSVETSAGNAVAFEVLAVTLVYPGDGPPSCETFRENIRSQSEGMASVLHVVPHRSFATGQR